MLSVANVPVLVVCTAGLPREALVEAEIVGFANNTIPPGQFKHLESTQGEVHQDQRETGEGEVQQQGRGNLTAVVDAWPVWCTSLTGTANSSSTAVSQSAVVASNAYGTYSTYSNMTVLPRSLCFGFISVTQTAPAGTNLSSWDVERASEQLIQAVHSTLQQAGLDVIYLRSLRVYYMMNSVVSEDLAMAVAAHTQRLLGVTKLPILLVPMLSLQLNTTTCSSSADSSSMTVKGLEDSIVLLSAQLMAVDLAQVDTENWVNVKE